MKIYLSILISVFISAFLLFPGASVYAQKTVIKIALVTPEGSTWTNTLHRMVDEVRANTNGEIDFKSLCRWYQR